MPFQKMVSFKFIEFCFRLFLAFSFFLLFELISAFASESYFEVEIVEKLQSVVEKQRGQIKKLEQSNIEFKSDNEEVSNITNSSDSFTNFVTTNL